MLFANECLKFRVLHRPSLQPEEGDLLFYFSKNKIGLTLENTVPVVSSTFLNNFDNKRLYCFASIEGRNCFLWNIKGLDVKLNFVALKDSCLFLSEPFHYAVILGAYLFRWRTMNQYCGMCGARTEPMIAERAIKCSACDNIIYPKISPCIIVLITKGDEILLARSPHFPTGNLSVLAGFINPGETVEQGVLREVREEVGIEVKNLEYICSQPWLFPDSLMLGFIAEYHSGDLQIDPAEIEFAGWFNKNNLPVLPSKISIARHLIELHLSR